MTAQGLHQTSLRQRLRKTAMTLMTLVALVNSLPAGAHPHSLEDLLRLSLCQLLQLSFTPIREPVSARPPQPLHGKAA